MENVKEYLAKIREKGEVAKGDSFELARIKVLIGSAKLLLEEGKLEPAGVSAISIMELLKDNTLYLKEYRIAYDILNSVCKKYDEIGIKNKIVVGFKNECSKKAKNLLGLIAKAFKEEVIESKKNVTSEHDKNDLDDQREDDAYYLERFRKALSLCQASQKAEPNPENKEVVSRKVR